MDLALTPEQMSFRDEVRSWLRTNLPKDWIETIRAGSDISRSEAYDFLRQWQRKLYGAGFMGLTWPKEYGGGGGTLIGGLVLPPQTAPL